MSVSGVGLKAKRDMNVNKVNVLLSAYACDPHEGSESGAGWAILSAVACIAENVTVLTRCENAPALERATEELPCNVTVVRVSTRYDGDGATYRRYIAWLWRASKIVRRLSADFDIFHHATFASDWLPPPVLRGYARSTRFVWGPAGGNTYAPRSLVRRMGCAQFAEHTVRTIATRSVRACTRLMLSGRVDSFIAMNQDSVKSAPAGSSISVHPNCVLNYADPKFGPASRRVHTRKILFVGRLLNWKGIGLAVDCLRYLEEDWALSVLGDGPEMPRLQRLKEALGSRLELLGWQDHSAVLGHMKTSGVLLFPSLHDSGGWSAAEASAVGLPVVCLNLGGVSTMAGRNAVVVNVNPLDSLTQRIAYAVERTEALVFEVQRDWTLGALTSCLRGAYGLAELDNSQEGK